MYEEFKFPSECEFTTIQSFFMTLGILTGGFLSAWVATAFVLKNTYQYDSEKEPEEESEKEPEEEPEKETEELYENQYPLSEASNTCQNRIEIHNCIVVENTPDGEVIMMYDFDNDTFVYWSYNQNINYLYLETVARKYITHYNCKDLYINHDKFGNKQEDTEHQSSEESEEEPSEKASEKPRNSVFANLKNYKNKTEDSIELNKFIRKSNIMDFKYILNNTTSVKAKDIDYKSFKNTF